MKIEKVEGLLIGSDLVGANYVVRITTDSGLVGIGQSGAWGFPDAAAKVVEQYAEYLVGQDPFSIEHIEQSLYRLRPFRGNIVSGALSAIDIALWDIKGKHFGVPVWELLGGRFATGFACTCSSSRTPLPPSRRAPQPPQSRLHGPQVRPLSGRLREPHAGSRHRGRARHGGRRSRGRRARRGPDLRVASQADRG